MKELEILFNSKARPRILRFFFQNEKGSFLLKEIAKKCNLSPKIVKKELLNLKRINLIQRRIQKRKYFYNLNLNFPFLNEIRNLILEAPFVTFKELSSFFRKIEGIKLVVIAGIFLKEVKSPADLLIVGDRVKISKVSKIIKKIESLIAQEIRWCFMKVEEFNYRLEINDRFIKDIFDFRHRKIIDKLKK